jgi:hypothetical protein
VILHISTIGFRLTFGTELVRGQDDRRMASDVDASKVLWTSTPRPSSGAWRDCGKNPSALMRVSSHKLTAALKWRRLDRHHRLFARARLAKAGALRDPGWENESPQ